MVAFAAGGRGQGLAQPLAPYDPVPRVGAAILDGFQEQVSRPPASFLPRGSRHSDSRCPAQARGERPSGVGGGSFAFFHFFRRWLAASAQHLGLVACAAGGRGQGLAQPLTPYDPKPRVGAAILDGSQEQVSRPPFLLSAARQRAFGLPLPRASAGRASVRRRRWELCFFPFFSSLAGGFCPASGRGRLRGGRQGAGACAAPCPLQPRTPRWCSHS